MFLESLIKTYSYLGIAIGSFIEGEAVLAFGGIFASRGIFNFLGIMTAAFLGAVGGDQLFFFIGRFKGRAFLAKHPDWQDKIKIIYRYLEERGDWFIAGFRFLAGLRIIVPFVIGASPVKTSRYIALNFAGGFVWTVFYGLIGYFFGETLIRLGLFQPKILAVIAFVVIGIILVGKFKRRKKNDKKTTH